MDTESIGQLSFGDANSIEKRDAFKLPRRILDMWKLYGRREGTHCKTCQHLMRIRYHNRIYFKCAKGKLSHGAGTDWRASWTACGLYELGEQRTIEVGE